MKTLDEKTVIRVKSLINLLNDEDDSIYNIVRQRLMEAGEGALPFLETCLETDDSLLRERVKDVFESIAAASFKAQWRSYRTKHKDDVDLEEGVFLLAKFEYPHSDMRIYSDLLNSYATEFQSRLDPTVAPEEIAAAIANFFFVEKGFCGDETDYYNLDNHFIHRVMETKRGVPIALSVIYILVLRRLNFPVFGIGLPGHFIIRYDFGSKSIFADPYNAGRTLSQQDCQETLRQMGYSFKKQYLEPVTNRQILERMLRNLLLVYERESESNKIHSLIECIDILNLNV